MYILKVPDNVIYCSFDKGFRLYVSVDHPYTVDLGLVLDIEIYSYLFSISEKSNRPDRSHILFNFSTSRYFVTNHLCAIP